MTTKVDWSKAPRNATHALITGPDCDDNPRLIGAVTFAVRDVSTASGYVDCGGRALKIANWAWQVIEERPKDTRQDVVKNPKHYQIIDDIETIELISASSTVEMFKGYCFGNIVKYRMRAGMKDALQQDIDKANQYVDIFDKYKHLCK